MSSLLQHGLTPCVHAYWNDKNEDKCIIKHEPDWESLGLREVHGAAVVKAPHPGFRLSLHLIGHAFAYLLLRAWPSKAAVLTPSGVKTASSDTYTGCMLHI